MTEIAGKVALVTGGGSGIGRALAHALAAEGASVVVADIIGDNGRAVADEIAAAGGVAHAVVCDVSDRASVRRARGEAIATLGPVGLLFANAGASSFERLVDMSDDDVDWIVEANLMHVMHGLTTFVPDMIAAGDGHVVATASMAGVTPSHLPYHAPYAAAKMGIVGLMLNVRHELAEAGVGASVLCPGGTATGMRDHNPSYRPDRFGGPADGPLTVPDGVEVILTDVTWRPPEEVAQMVLLAVRENRPIVVTDPKDRELFLEDYVTPMLAAFDDVDRFERSRSGA